MTTAKTALKELTARATPAKAARQQSFFKTGEGQYSAGDRFLGVTVPEIRKLIPLFGELPEGELSALLASPYNEARLLALLVMVARYEKGDAKARGGVYRFYLDNLGRVNNWNLVDASAHYIVGAHLVGKDKKILRKLSESKDMWARRVAVVATWAFIRENDCEMTFSLSKKLLKDKEDLMHKACGWMLREAGKRDLPALEEFLRENHEEMPRTMLRYAIEKFPEPKRKRYLTGRF